MSFAFHIAHLAALIEAIEIIADPDTRNLIVAGLEDVKNGRVVDHEDVKREFE